MKKIVFTTTFLLSTNLICFSQNVPIPPIKEKFTLHYDSCPTAIISYVDTIQAASVVFADSSGNVKILDDVTIMRHYLSRGCFHFSINKPEDRNETWFNDKGIRIRVLLYREEGSNSWSGSDYLNLGKR